MFTQMRSNLKFLGSILFALVFLAGGVLTINTAFAATAVIYDAIPSPLPFNMGSLGFQATQTSEFGDYVHLAGTDRILNTVTVKMSDWALHSAYPSMDAAGWTHPITLNIYNAVPGTPLNTKGSLIGTVTQTFTIPWRPEADPTCTTPTAWRAGDSNCYNGLAFNVTFDLSALNLTLPSDVIVGVAYNTQSYGVAPIDVSGPYNSLNVGEEGSATVGTDNNTDRVFWNTSLATNYTDGGTGGFGIFREDTAWGKPSYSLAAGTLPMQITAALAVVAPTLSLTGIPATVTTETAATEDGNGIVTGFTVGSRTPIQVTLTKGSTDYSKVRIEVTGVNSGVQLLATDGTTWYNIAKTGWGDPTGFPIATATTSVYLVANTPGTYTATIKLVDVSNSNAELATATASVTANAPAPIPAPSHGNSSGSKPATPAIPANVTTPDGCAAGDKFSSTTGRNCNAATPAVPAGQVLGASTQAGKVLGAEKFNFTKFLKFKAGSYKVSLQGAEVIELQKFLATLGYDLGTADGKFGAKTNAAVIKFQIANGLKGDGVIGALTRAMLNK